MSEYLSISEPVNVTIPLKKPITLHYQEPNK